MTQLLTSRQVAELLGVSEDKVYRMCLTHEIPFYKIGSKRMFSEEKITGWLAEQEVRMQK